MSYDAVAVFSTIFRELEWKTSIYFWRAVPKIPNTAYDVLIFRGMKRGSID
jgi:hypothetical protein